MPKKQPEAPIVKAGSVLEYLRTAPPALLQAFELTHLNHVAMLRKQLVEILDQMIRETAEASLARVLLENRQELMQKPRRNGTGPADRIAEVVKKFPHLNQFIPEMKAKS